MASKRAVARKAVPGAGKQLDEAALEDLRKEIGLLREMLHQVAEQAAGDLEGQMKLLTAVGRACTQLANLVKVQKQIGSKTTLMDEIGRIAAEIQEERGEIDW